MKVWIRKLLKEVKDFCGAEWVGIFGRWDEKANVLELIATNGLPRTFQENDGYRALLHFNWNKAKLPEDNLVHSQKSQLLETGEYISGLKHRKGPDQKDLTIMQKADIRIAQIHPGGEKTLLCICGLSERINLHEEQDFLLLLNQRISSQFVRNNEIVRRIVLQDRSDKIADHIAHQIKSTLTPIRNVIELTKLRLEQSNSEEAIKDALKKLDALDQNVDTLSDLSTMTSMQLREETREDSVFELKPEQFEGTDLIGFVKEIINEFNDKVSAKHLRIELNPRTSSPIFVSLVRPAMWICFANLFDNALKYCSTKTTIKISFSYDDPIPFFAEKVTIIFSTIGQRIDLDETEKVFEHGIQGKYAQNEEGLGLGLWECREILKAHKNSKISLKVESSNSYEETRNIFIIEINVRKRRREHGKNSLLR